MKKKKLLSLTLIVCMLVTMLAGCGGSSATSTDNSSAAAPAAESSAAGGEETAHLDLRACVEDRGVLRIRVGRVLHIRVRKGDRRHAERIQTSPRRARLIRNTISTSKGSSKRSQENNNDQTASALENKLEKSHRAPLHVRRHISLARYLRRVPRRLRRSAH